MKIVIINGLGLSGKDEFIKQIQLLSLQNENSIKIINISSIDCVKEQAKNFGWHGEKNEKSRKFLAELKNIWIEYNNGPFNNIIEKVKIQKEQNTNCIMFIHCREISEIEKFKKYFKDAFFITLLIKRNVETPNNIADSQVFDYQYDYTIDNDGDILDLKEKAKVFLNFILKK